MPYTGILGGYEYPYNSPTQPNLDWMLKKIKELETAVSDLDARVKALEAKQ